MTELIAECVICLDAIRDADPIRTLQCNHTFHATCIDLWVQEKAECPVCRQGFEKEQSLVEDVAESPIGENRVSQVDGPLRRHLWAYDVFWCIAAFNAVCTIVSDHPVLFVWSVTALIIKRKHRRLLGIAGVVGYMQLVVTDDILRSTNRAGTPVLLESLYAVSFGAQILIMLLSPH